MAKIMLQSGAELADHIAREAAAKGVNVSRFLAPIFGNPASMLSSIRKAKAPTRATLDRINRLLTTQVIMPTVTDRVEVGSGKRLEGIAAIKALTAQIRSGAIPANRNTCFTCGTRIELGCSHHAATRPKVDTSLAFWPLDDDDKDGRNVLVRDADNFAIAKFTRMGWVYSGSHRVLDFAPTHAYDPARRDREASHG